MVKLVLALNKQALQKKLEKYLKHGYRANKEFELKNKCGDKIIGKVFPIQIETKMETLKGIRADDVDAGDVAGYIIRELSNIMAHIRLLIL